MNKRKLIFLLTVLGILCLPLTPSLAQNNNVEINFDVLDQLAGPRSAPPKGMPAVPPAKVERAEIISGEIKPLLPAQSFIPPKPGRKPVIISQDTLKELAGVEEGPKVLPPQPSPVEIKSSVPVEPVIQKVITEEVIPEPAVAKEDPLGKDLVTPSVQDILASIDPENTKEEKAPISQVSENNIISLGYAPGVSELPKDIEEELKSKMGSKAKTKPQARIEVVAYASAPDDNPATARRISLARALEIRGLLIEEGIESTRIDLRPMGENTDITPRDRVDIQFVE